MSAQSVPIGQVTAEDPVFSSFNMVCTIVFFVCRISFVLGWNYGNGFPRPRKIFKPNGVPEIDGSKQNSVAILRLFNPDTFPTWERASDWRGGHDARARK